MLSKGENGEEIKLSYFWHTITDKKFMKIINEIRLIQMYSIYLFIFILFQGLT